AGADGDHLDRPPALGSELGMLRGDQAHHGGADRAETGETHFEGGSHNASATPHRHSGARRRREPEIQRHASRPLLDSGPGAARRPGVTVETISSGCYRPVARGTTLCNFSGADSRNRRMLHAACRMRCSFSTSAMRTNPSPRSPKPVPGDTATSAFSTRSLENSTLPRPLNGSGIGDQANIEAAGGGTSHPARPKLSTSTSRRRL